MVTLWNNLLHILNTMPIWLAAVLIGWAMSFTITHAFKFLTPQSLDAWLREDLNRFVAFFSGAIFSGWWAVEAGYGLMGMTLVAVFTGVWSPMAFALTMMLLRKSPKTEWIADVLTADKRGVLFSKLLDWIWRTPPERPS